MSKNENRPQNNNEQPYKEQLEHRKLKTDQHKSNQNNILQKTKGAYKQLF